MAKKKFAIFDLDQTLVDSQVSAKARKDHDWPKALALIPKIQMYPGVADLLKTIRRAGYKVAIVTNSPRTYCDGVCAQLHIAPDAMVCYHDVSRPKPHRHGVMLAAALLHGFGGDGKQLQSVNDFLKKFPDWRNESIVIGDSWVDSIAARRAYIDVIGAEWGAEDKRELLLSGITYWAQSVAQLQDQLIRLSKTFGPLQPERANALDAFNRGLWAYAVNTEENDFRRNLRKGQGYHYARHRWTGDFSISYGNDLISAFKRTDPDLRWAKIETVKKFAQELGAFLPRKAQVVFLRSSKLPSDPEYDDRFELLEASLKAIRRDITFLQPISPTKSKTAASKSDDKSLRDPAEIIKDLRWTMEQELTGLIYVVDDVMTSGGHFEAYIRMFNQHAPKVSTIGVFWTLHMGEL